jgi:hypothetical protein
VFPQTTEIEFAAHLRGLRDFLVEFFAAADKPISVATEYNGR